MTILTKNISNLTGHEKVWALNAKEEIAKKYNIWVSLFKFLGFVILNSMLYFFLSL